MTDEELAEKEYENLSQKKIEQIGHYCDKAIFVTGFLAGLKAGRPQWHDLRKNPDDYPKHHEDFFSISEMVIIKEENKKNVAFAYYCYDDQAWYYWDTDGYVENKIIAWCDYPKWEETREIKGN